VYCRCGGRRIRIGRDLACWVGEGELEFGVICTYFDVEASRLKLSSFTTVSHTGKASLWSIQARFGVRNCSRSLEKAYAA
jgi:hypothetical protein